MSPNGFITIVLQAVKGKIAINEMRRLGKWKLRDVGNILATKNKGFTRIAS